MHLFKKIFTNRAVINVSDETFGVTFTHWAWKKGCWSLRWDDVIAIDAMQVEPAFIGLGFFIAKNRWKFVSEDMENWNLLQDAVRKGYPDFNWDHFEQAKGFIESRFPCWKRQE